MRLERLTLKDFRSYQDADIDLSGVQLASVVGPNGAGKSSLLEGVDFALTGARKLRNLNDFIRKGCEECGAGLTFSTGGERYRVTRVRSSRNSGKSTVELARQDDSGLWVAEGTGAKDTDERLRQILGVDEETLLRTAFVAQGDAGSFFALQAAARLEALGSILKLDERFGPLEERFKAQAAAAKTNLEQARRDVERLEFDVIRLEQKRDELAEAGRSVERAEQSLESDEEAVAGARDALAKARDAAAGYELAVAKRDELLKRKDDLEARAGDLNDEYDNLYDRICNREELENALAVKPDLEAELARLEADREADRELDTDRRRIQDAVAVAEAALEQARSDWAVAERQKKTVEVALTGAGMTRERIEMDLAGIEARRFAIEHAEVPVCDRCGQSIESESFARTLAGIETEREAAQDRLIAASASIEKATVAVAEAGDAMAALMSRGGDAREMLSTLTAELAALPAPCFGSTRYSIAERRLADLSEIPAKLAMIATLEERLAVVEAERKAIMDQLEDPSLVDDLVDTEGAVREAEDSRERAKRAELNVRAFEDTVSGSRRLLSEAERAAARIEGEVASLAPCRDQLAEAQTAAKTHEEEQADAELLRKAMGKWGVPALIVGNVLLSLEVEVNELLSLYEGSLALRFEGEKETGNGARDSLEIVCFDGEMWRPLESFSGGEQYRFASAMRIGLSFLLAHRSGSRVQTLVLDEPEGLDAAGRANLVRLLERASSHFDLVLMMSHFADLQEAFPSQILVSRGADGLSHAEVVG